MSSTARNEAQLVPVSEAPITMVTMEMLSKGPTVPERYKNQPKDMWAAALYGRELGLPPMQSIHQIYLIDGTASMKAAAMSALVFARGHELRTKTSLKGAEVTAWRRDPYTHELNEVGQVNFGPEDAERAGLANKSAYKKYPMAMYAARAQSMACRLFFGDVLAGITYTPDEVNVDEFDPTLDDGVAIVTDLEDGSDILDVEEIAEELEAEVVDG